MLHYSLVDKYSPLATLYTDTNFGMVLHEYLSKIAHELDVMVRHGVHTTLEKLSYGHLYIVQHDIVSGKHYPTIVNIYKLSFATFKLEDEEGKENTTHVLDTACRKLMARMRLSVQKIVGRGRLARPLASSGPSADCGDRRNCSKGPVGCCDDGVDNFCGRSMRDKLHKIDKSAKVDETGEPDGGDKEHKIMGPLDTYESENNDSIIPDTVSIQYDSDSDTNVCLFGKHFGSNVGNPFSLDRDDNDDNDDEEDDDDNNDGSQEQEDGGRNARKQERGMGPEMRKRFLSHDREDDDDPEKEEKEEKDEEDDEEDEEDEEAKEQKERDQKKLEEEQDRQREFRINKERAEEKKRVFVIDRTVYKKMKQNIKDGTLKEDKIPELFSAKYPVFKFMDENDLLDDEDAYESYVCFYDDVYPKVGDSGDDVKDKDGDETEQQKKYIPHNINYLGEEEQKKFAAAKEEKEKELKELDDFKDTLFN